jgi:hypothetical protein
MTRPAHWPSLEEIMNDERYPQTRTRRARRRNVVLEAVLLTALTAAFALPLPGDWATRVVVLVVGFVAFVPLHAQLNLGIRGVFDLRRSALDEHQFMLRAYASDATRWWAHGLTLLLLVASLATVALTDDLFRAFGTGYVLWMVAGLLPSWWLAWQLGDEEAEPESADAAASPA